MILWIAEASSGGADLKQTRPGAGAAGVGDVGGHMSASVDVDVAADVAIDVVVAAGVADVAGAPVARCPYGANADGAGAGENRLDWFDQMRRRRRRPRRPRAAGGGDGDANVDSSPYSKEVWR